MKYETLKLQRDGSIATVTMARPDRLNALSLEAMRELEAAATELREDTAVRAIILAGEGKHFCAGADLKDAERAALRDEPLLARQRAAALGPRMIRAWHELPQITIAAIHGACLGGGAVLATACDFRIGASDCTVGYPEIALGINLSWYGVPLCANLVGPARAKRLVILGNRERAADLLAWGFLDEAVPPERLQVRVREMAAEYASRPPIAAQMIKRSINAATGALDMAVMHADADQLLLAQSTADHAEGVAAFLEKRNPEFKGA